MQIFNNIFVFIVAVQRTINSQKRKPHLLHEGFRFRCDRILTDGSESWRCIMKNCPGRMRASPQDEVFVVNEHNHSPNPGQNEVLKIVAEIRRRAATTNESPSEIIKRASAGLPSDVVKNLPALANAQRMIQRQRRRQL